MLVCRDATELATEYLEGELAWRQRLGVVVHLLRCDPCRRYFGQLRQTARLLGRLPSRLPDPATEARIVATAHRSTPGEPAD